jgi:anion-transporting  ArsA/GET3 family ATPase
MPSTQPDLPKVRLHVVTGKGGTGKTTVASALALAMARRGRRVLLAEVEGRQGISQTFDIAPLGHRETRILHDRTGGELWGLSVDAKESLREYLQKFYKVGRAMGVLDRFGAVDFATTIAPGVRDVLLIGKVYEAAGRRTGKAGAPVYDAVVLDAPPTGRVARFLNVNAEVADVARVGPIRTQADSITRMLRSHTTAVHIVTLLEEMPVQETVDAQAELRAVGLHGGHDGQPRRTAGPPQPGRGRTRRARGR